MLYSKFNYSPDIVERPDYDMAWVKQDPLMNMYSAEVENDVEVQYSQDKKVKNSLKYLNLFCFMLYNYVLSITHCNTLHH